MNDRYKDNPMLRLLDCYILDAIGELPADQAATLVQLEPRLRQTFHEEGSWREIVESQLGLKEAAIDEIRRFWAGYREHAKQQGVQVGPFNFVTDFVNQNFPRVLWDE